jgi:hypothetical protein
LDADGVGGDIDAPRLRRYRIRVLVDRLLVKRIDLRGLGLGSLGRDLSSDAVELVTVRPARKSLAPSRAKAGATAPPIAPAPP